MNKKNILIVELGGIGDVVMSIPAMEAVIRHYKDGAVTILTVPKTAPIIEMLRSHIDMDFCVRVLDLKGKGYLNWFNLIRILRREKYDIVIDLSSIESLPAAIKRFIFLKSLRSRLLAGRNTDGRGWAYDMKADEILISEVHEVERKLKVVRLLGIKPETTVPKISTMPADRKETGDFLGVWLEGKKPIIGINPAAYRPSRMWPEERFSDLIRFLEQRFHANVVIIGGEKERDLIERIIAASGVNAKVAIQWPFPSLTALIERFDLMVTNDTGSMHLAAALNVPMVVCFDQNNLHRYRPYMEKERCVVIKKDYRLCPYFSFKHPMSECKRYSCPTHECMRAITVEEVETAVETLLHQTMAVS